MCRFAVYLGSELTIGSLVTEPANSIIHQSFDSHERVEPLNGDGFGIAWYVPGDEQPVVFKDVSPAWSNINLRSVARATRTTCMLAHVRAATVGLPVQQLNCHPFAFKGLSFMHNGTLGGFRKIRRAMLESLSNEAFNWIKGSTDSEHVFALFVDRYREAREQHEGLEAIKRALVTTIAQTEDFKRAAGVREASLLNLVVCDGRQVVVSRYISDTADTKANTLYVHRGGRYVCEDGACRMEEADGDETSVIVASEPLSSDPGWDRIEPGSLVTVDAQRRVEVATI